MSGPPDIEDETTNNSPRPSAEQRKPRFGIRLLVALVGVGVTVLAVMAVGASQERDTRRALTSELEARVLLEARNLALTSSLALLDEFPELTLQPLITEKQKRQPELKFLVVLDREGTILGHPDQRRLGESFKMLPGTNTHPTQRQLQSRETMLANSELLIVLAPIEYREQAIGQVAVGIERNYIDQLLREARMRQLGILAVVLVVAASISFGLMTKLLRPIDSLRRGVERIGRGDLQSPITVDESTEIGLLASSVNEMAADLLDAQSEMVEKERLARELELAHEIQSGLLPSQKREVGTFLIDGTHEAAFEVGGDFYDFFDLPDGRIGIAIADVAGKGLAGCLVMSMLSALLGAFRDQFESPAELLAKLDERLGEGLMAGSFVTMFYGILDPTRGRMCFASAGHMPTLVYRKKTGSVEEFRTRGIPLCAIRGGAIRQTLHDEWVDLGEGDLLLQYTDGINETLGPDGKDQFDFHRMHAVLNESASAGASRLIKDLISAITAFRGGPIRDDDETVVVVSRELAAQTQSLQPGVEDASIQIQTGKGPDDEALSYLAEAELRGVKLELRSDLDGLAAIRDWLNEQNSFRDLEPSKSELLWTALYEACANIAEHGYGRVDHVAFSIWWIPDEIVPNPTIASGRFVLRDRGKQFSPTDWSETDFSDPKVWRQYRGFGLDIIHGVMQQVIYRPGTESGNVTVLQFDPQLLETEERSNVRAV